MNNTVIVLIVILTAVCIAVLLLQYMFMTMMKRMLRAGAKAAIEAAWKKVSAHENPVLKVVEADKILDEALRLLGYQGSLGEKLKAAGPRFSNLNALWSAHKLRNTLVHELQATPKDKEVENAIQAFHAALTDLGAKL